MKALLLPCLAVLSLAFSGCSAVYSAHPLNTSDDAVEEPAIEGTWTPANQNDDPPLCIQKLNQQVYAVISDPDTKVVHIYSVDLVELDAHLFANMTATGQMVDGKEVDPPFGVVPHNIILKVDVDDIDLAWSVLSVDAIQERNKTASAPLSYIALSDDDMLLSASSDELRQYISIYSDQIFGAQHHYIRKSDSELTGGAESQCGLPPFKTPPNSANN